MENAEIVKTIEELEGLPDDRTKAGADEVKKMIVFSVQENIFAFYAEYIREILLDSELFHIPFTPLYITGLINRHGEPYTVFDINVLLSASRTDSRNYLILNIPNDKAAVMITDILEIIKVPADKIQLLTMKDEGNYYSGSFQYKEKEVFIVNISALLRRLEHDIENT